MTRRAWILGVLLVVVGCQRDEPAPANEPAPPAPSELDGAMCAEHGVLEAVCTKCNPALANVFKAKGDWCEEHGFPESFCPICHPERGGKPSADVSRDDGVAEGTKVRFKSKEIARLAGIEDAPATERTRLVEIEVTARVLYDATKVAEVNARTPGVIRAIVADVGTKVEVGSPLAGFASATIGADQSRLQAARSRVRVAEANYARLKKLLDARLAAENDVLAARHELDAAKADRAAARSALSVVGGIEGSSKYELSSPIAGVVTRRSATIGHHVDTDEVLFEIVDTSSMWAELDVPEADARRVSVGQSVTVVPDGLPDGELVGVLSYLAPEIDPHTRTVRGRVALENPDGTLRAHMFARARIAVAGSGEGVFVPRAAVQRGDEGDLVFVKLAEDLFEARRVEVGPGDAELVEVTGRVAPGDRVATAGSFLLKTETLKGAIGAGCCEVE
jgi:cobalt-zinc-cadmium efflux system membrane fusion protein